MRVPTLAVLPLLLVACKPTAMLRWGIPEIFIYAGTLNEDATTEWGGTGVDVETFMGGDYALTSGAWTCGPDGCALQ